MTITDTRMQLAEAIEQAKLGGDFMIRCPAPGHGSGKGDHNPSLHVTPADNGVLVKCMADCETPDILAAVNLEWGDLFNEPLPGSDSAVTGQVWTPQGYASHVYQYRDEAGNVVYEVLRIPHGRGKTFMQRRPSGDPDRPIWKLDGVDRVLYRLPEIIRAVAAGEVIYVVEGEKDAEAMVRRGYQGTCNAQGAGKWLPQFTATLAGATVVVVQDADNTGRAHGRMVCDALRRAGCKVEIREAPHPHKDVSDVFAAGLGLNDLLVVDPFEVNERVKFGIDVLDVILRKVSDIEWVIPGVMARRERLLITGFEGHGKSTLLRMLGVQASAGIHWFSLADMEPLRCLFVDGENEPSQTLQSWKDLVELAAFWDHPVDKGQLVVLEEWDSDTDLASGDGTAWLHERIHAYQPDICFIGPLTNMVGRDLKDDEPVRRLKAAINSSRTICGTAFVMEHHAPHKNPTDKRRSVRPYGSSMFLKWPDYGYGLQPHVDFEGVYLWERTRWPRVRNRGWPQALRWGRPGTADWPWVECLPDAPA